MRQIIFRGKHSHAMSCNTHFDGQWVYGYLADEDYINSVEYGEMFVDPETVGQYIGLDDINGNNIFEGDIVKWGHITLTLDRMGITPFAQPFIDYAAPKKNGLRLLNELARWTNRRHLFKSCTFEEYLTRRNIIFLLDSK